jgi:hypothetical protein
MAESAREKGQRLIKDVCGFEIPPGMSRFADMTVDALQRGDLTQEELDEIVIQITHYGGWPRGTVALGAASKAAASAEKKE